MRKTFNSPSEVRLAASIGESWCNTRVVISNAEHGIVGIQETVPSKNTSGASMASDLHTAFYYS